MVQGKRNQFLAYLLSRIKLSLKLPDDRDEISIADKKLSNVGCGRKRNERCQNSCQIRAAKSVEVSQVAAEDDFLGSQSITRFARVNHAMAFAPPVAIGRILST